MEGFHSLWLAALAAVAVLLLGPSRLPEIGSALGGGVRSFREALAGTDKESTAVYEQAEPCEGG